MTKKEFKATFAEGKRWLFIQRSLDALDDFCKKNLPPEETGLIDMDDCDPLFTRHQPTIKALEARITHLLHVRQQYGQPHLDLVIADLEARRIALYKQQTRVRYTTNPNDITIAQIRDYPLLELLSRYHVIYHRTGPNRHKCICQAHNEDTPSCVIYEDQNRWHCYGCGAHGTAIDMMMALEGISMQEAIKNIKKLME